jgi:hypothetical protein
MHTLPKQGCSVKQRCKGSHSPLLLYLCLVFVILGFDLRSSHLLGRGSITWVTPLTLFGIMYFQDRVLHTVCPGWLRTTILLISASWIARITGTSHQDLCFPIFFYGPTIKETTCNVNNRKVIAWVCLLFSNLISQTLFFSLCLTLLKHKPSRTLNLKSTKESMKNEPSDSPVMHPESPLQLRCCGLYHQEACPSSLE